MLCNVGTRTVAPFSEIAIVTKDLIQRGIAGLDDLEVKTIPASFLPVFVTTTIDVIEAHKLNPRLATTHVLAAI